MQTLLEKIRYMSRQLTRCPTGSVVLETTARLLQEALSSNVLVLDAGGGLAAWSLSPGWECEVLERDIVDERRVPAEFSVQLSFLKEAVVNLPRHRPGGCLFMQGPTCPAPGMAVTAIPVSGGGVRLGTLLIGRRDAEFCEDDLVIAEYAGTVVSMQMMHLAMAEEGEVTRKEAAVDVALDSLSFSEMRAIQQVFDELKGNEGFLVASRVADRAGITRSVIVNALRKFESAGVIEARSLGMKGTFIRVLNDRLLERLSRDGR